MVSALVSIFVPAFFTASQKELQAAPVKTRGRDKSAVDFDVGGDVLDSDATAAAVRAIRVRAVPQKGIVDRKGTGFEFDVDRCTGILCNGQGQSRAPFQVYLVLQDLARYDNCAELVRGAQQREPVGPALLRVVEVHEREPAQRHEPAPRVKTRRVHHAGPAARRIPDIPLHTRVQQTTLE